MELQRRHVPVKGSVPLLDARQQPVAGTDGQGTVRKRMHGVNDAVDKDRERIRVVDEVGGVPGTQIQVDEEFRGRMARTVAPRRFGDKVEVARARPGTR